MSNEVQKVCLELLIEVDRICTQHNINYYIYGGTLLGAVRHNGFIPWDDDIDIVMFRSEYDKFVKICKNELGEKYYLQTIENEPLSPLSWGNLYKKNTAFIQSFINKECFQGISIDIFALDNIPNNKLNRKIYGLIHDFLNAVFWERFIINSKPTGIKRKIVKFVSSMSRIIPNNKYRKLHDKLITIYNNKQSKYVVHNSFRKFSKKIIPIEYFKESCMLNFEGEKFRAPSKWNEILKLYYGENFMEIPDKDNQITHSVDIVDCNNSWEIYTNNI